MTAVQMNPVWRYQSPMEEKMKKMVMVALPNHENAFLLSMQL